MFDFKVKAVLLCASESWTITQRMTDGLQVFVNKMFAKDS